eukprot:6108609-Alexandrium_andersonii.AAC.1
MQLLRPTCHAVCSAPVSVIGSGAHQNASMLARRPRCLPSGTQLFTPIYRATLGTPAHIMGTAALRAD